MYISIAVMKMIIAYLQIRRSYKLLPPKIKPLYLQGCIFILEGFLLSNLQLIFKFNNFSVDIWHHAYLSFFYKTFFFQFIPEAKQIFKNVKTSRNAYLLWQLTCSWFTENERMVSNDARVLSSIYRNWIAPPCGGVRI